jgi:hypothetical protein
LERDYDKRGIAMGMKTDKGSAKRGRPGRPVWVDGVEHSSLQAAARALGASRQSVRDILDTGGGTVKGRVISAAPPKPAPKSKPAASRARAPDSPLVLPPNPGPRIPLLRYPPGEGPLRQGLRHWR